MVAAFFCAVLVGQVGAKGDTIIKGHTASGTPICIATGGEIFPDGNAIELLSPSGDSKCPRLLHWDGEKGTVGTSVECHGRIYEPPPINPSILSELTLPSHVSAHRPTRDLLTELSRQATHIAGLPEKIAAVAARAVLCSWIIRAVPIAPAVVITGPDGPHGNQLARWFRCVCRHSLPISGVTAEALCSLPAGLEFTLLITQSKINDKVQALLDGVARMDQRILLRGKLLDLFGVQIIRSESTVGGSWWSFRRLEIPVTPATHELPIFDQDMQHRIAGDFQPALLRYRFATFRTASHVRFDASRFTYSLRELITSLAATTPDDRELQRELFDLLQGADREIRSAKWLDLTILTIEAMLVVCRESPGGTKYVGEVAAIASEIRNRRGVPEKIDAGEVGKMLRHLGIATEARNAKGVPVRLTDAVCRRVQQLARDFGVPETENGDDVEAGAKGMMMSG